MTVRFVPLPVGRDLDNVVGVHFLPAEWVSPNIRVRDRILEKRASVLNVSAMSYVVAVVSTDPYCTEHDVRRGTTAMGRRTTAGTSSMACLTVEETAGYRQCCGFREARSRGIFIAQRSTRRDAAIRIDRSFLPKTTRAAS